MKVVTTEGYLPALQADYQSSSVPAVDEVGENADVPAGRDVATSNQVPAIGGSDSVRSSAGGSSS